MVIDYVDAEKIEREGVEVLDGASAILVPGGFGQRDLRKIAAAGFARRIKSLSRDLLRDACRGH